MDDIYFADPSNTTYETITANGKGLMRDFGLKAKTIQIGMPDIWQHLVEVPGRNGPIDMTDFAGRPAFKSRQILMSLDKEESYTDWLTKYTELVNFLYGNRFNILIMPDDKHYFTGRCLFNMTKDNDVITDHEFTITCDPMRTIIPSFEELYSNVETGITGIQQYYDVDAYIGKYAHDMIFDCVNLTGTYNSSLSVYFYKDGKLIKIFSAGGTSITHLEIPLPPVYGECKLRIYGVVSFTATLENKEL